MLKQIYGEEDLDATRVAGTPDDPDKKWNEPLTVQFPSSYPSFVYGHNDITVLEHATGSDHRLCNFVSRLHQLSHLNFISCYRRINFPNWIAFYTAPADDDSYELMGFADPISGVQWWALRFPETTDLPWPVAQLEGKACSFQARQEQRLMDIQQYLFEYTSITVKELITYILQYLTTVWYHSNTR
jgi:hypothetical protein